MRNYANINKSINKNWVNGKQQNKAAPPFFPAEQNAMTH